MKTNWERLCQDALEQHPYPKILESVNLPAMPGVIQTFLERAADPDASAGELAATLKSDSGITCELLRHVNSAAVSGRGKIGSVTEAVTVLGLKKMKTFVTTVGMQAAMISAKTRVMNLNTFWNESLQRALFAGEVARAGNIPSDDAFLGALLQDFLLPVLTSKYPEEYFDYLKLASAESTELCEYERCVLGCDHATAAAHLAWKWNLPETVICCIFYHHQIASLVSHEVLGDSVCLPVAMSSLLLGQMRQVPHGEERLATLDSTTSVFDLISVCQAVDEQLQALASNIKVQFPLTRRFQQLVTSS